MNSWCQVPTFVILSTGQFTANAEIRGYALNSHWYRIFRRCISRFPHLIVPLRRNKNAQPHCTAYDIVRGEYVVEFKYSGEILQFQSLRHVTVTDNLCWQNIPMEVWGNLGWALHQLPELQTITLDILNGAKISSSNFIANLPKKVTSVNMGFSQDFAQLEKHFAQLIHCEPPWTAESERFYSRMPNLRSFVFEGIPESFQFFAGMHQLQRLTWHLSQDITVAQWNDFAQSLNPSLSTLEMECDGNGFERVLFTPNTSPLPGLKRFFLKCYYRNQHLPLNNINSVMPGLEHLHLYLPGVKTAEDSDSLCESMPAQAAEMQLDTFSVYFSNTLCRSTRLTYCKGDSIVNARHSDRQSATFDL